MTRRPSALGGSESALYGWLLAREERTYASPSGGLLWTPEQPSHDGSEQRLAALKAGEKVDVPLSALPKWARAGQDLGQPWRRARVSADGAVEFYEDDGSAWLAEHGL